MQIDTEAVALDKINVTVLNAFLKGEKGDTGETGATGPQGIQGIQGVQGPKGDTGEKGDKGDAFEYNDFTPEQLELLRGPQGVQGMQGPQGEKGENGAKGDKGETGDVGPRGPQGIQGIQGIQGEKGDKGDKGDAFTYADFTPAQLEALRGPQGIQGIQGPKGDTGDTGATGEQGPKGDTGATGPANNLTIGTVESGTTADATITGTTPNQVLNLVLPKGDKGDKGDTGPQGPTPDLSNYLEKTGGTITGNLTVNNQLNAKSDVNINTGTDIATTKKVIKIGRKCTLNNNLPTYEWIYINQDGTGAWELRRQNTDNPQPYVRLNIAPTGLRIAYSGSYNDSIVDGQYINVLDEDNYENIIKNKFYDKNQVDNLVKGAGFTYVPYNETLIVEDLEVGTYISEYGTFSLKRENSQTIKNIETLDGKIYITKRFEDAEDGEMFGIFVKSNLCITGILKISEAPEGWDTMASFYEGTINFQYDPPKCYEAPTNDYHLVNKEYVDKGETTLLDSQKDNAGTYTLSDSIASYKFLDIYYQTGSGSFVKRVYNNYATTKTIQIAEDFIGIASNQAFPTKYFINLLFNGTSIQIVNMGQYNDGANNGEYNYSEQTNGDAGVFLTKIVGYTA